jgi:hypothetical protein
MPFDSAPQQADDLLTFTPGREGLRKLATLLRMQMPPTFEWDYAYSEITSECGTQGCAFGLCRVMWPESFEKERRGFRMVTQMATRFGLSFDDSRELFQSSYGRESAHKWSNVRPAEVADAIDAYLARTS